MKAMNEKLELQLSARRDQVIQVIHQHHWPLDDQVDPKDLKGQVGQVGQVGHWDQLNRLLLQDQPSLFPAAHPDHAVPEARPFLDCHHFH